MWGWYCSDIDHFLQHYLDNSLERHSLIDKVDELSSLKLSAEHVFIGIQIDLVQVLGIWWSSGDLLLQIFSHLHDGSMVCDDTVVIAGDLGDSYLLLRRFV